MWLAKFEFDRLKVGEVEVLGMSERIATVERSEFTGYAKQVHKSRLASTKRGAIDVVREQALAAARRLRATLEKLDRDLEQE